MDPQWLNYGLPAALLATVGYGAWRGLGWAANHLALPALQALLRFLEELRESQRSQTKFAQSVEAQLVILNGQIHAIQRDNEQLQSLILQVLRAKGHPLDPETVKDVSAPINQHQSVKEPKERATS